MKIDPALALVFAKMLTTAAIVVTASLLAERTKPLVAALIATLPVSAGPVYAFLAMDHDAPFIAQAALASMAANMGTAGFVLTYVIVAARVSTLLALLLSLGAHLGLLVVFQHISLPFMALFMLTIVGYAVLHGALRSRIAAKPKSAPKLAWYAIPLRAAFVAALTGAVTALSARIGPLWSGLFATFPVVLSTLVLFLQPRIGGPATAAIMASGLLGLMGFGIALAVVHVTAIPFGSWTALGLGLAVCVAWNLGIGALAWMRTSAR